MSNSEKIAIVAIIVAIITGIPNYVKLIKPDNIIIVPVQPITETETITETEQTTTTVFVNTTKTITTNATENVIEYLNSTQKLKTSAP